MNVSSPPPLPLPLVVQTGRGPVQPVRAHDPARDAASDDERKPATTRIPSELSEEDSRRAAQLAMADRDAAENGARARRAMAAYAGVAEDAERQRLQSLLGLDTYA